MNIVRIVAWVLAISGTLFSFPEILPWVLGGWLAFAVFRSFKGRNVALPLAIMALTIYIKWPEPVYSLVLLSVALTTSAFMIALKMHRQMLVAVPDDESATPVVAPIPDATRAKLLATICLLLCSALWGFYLVEHYAGKSASRAPLKLHPTRPVVCVGDSLTDYGYPAELEKRISIPVVDLGFNGYTSGDGIDLLPQILAAKPRAVILELGGHDYKDGEPRKQTHDNLQHIIDICSGIGAEVIIVEIPRGFINDPYYGLDRQLARQNDLHLIPDTMIRRLVFWSAVVPPGAWFGEEWHNSDDGLHPNDRGNRMMAGYVANALEKVFGPEVRRDPR